MQTRLHRIDGPWLGRLAILPRPRGGDWLNDEIRAWKDAGVNNVVSTLEDEEIDSLNLDREMTALREQGLEAIAFPIPDRGIPESYAESRVLFQRLCDSLQDGKYVGVHCRQGIGRSSMVAAGLLIFAGVAPDEAWKRVETARGCRVPDTPEQKAWVQQFAQSVTAKLGIANQILSPDGRMANEPS